MKIVSPRFSGGDHGDIRFKAKWNTEERKRDPEIMAKFHTRNSHTQDQLERVADAIIRLDAVKQGLSTTHFGILDYVNYAQRLKPEIYNDTGIANQHIANGIYWRTAKGGRNFIPRTKGETRAFYA